MYSASRKKVSNSPCKAKFKGEIGAVMLGHSGLQG